MTRDEALLCWLYACPGMTRQRARRLIERYGALDAVWREWDERALDALGEKVYHEMGARRDIRVVDALMDAVEHGGMQIAQRGTREYPPLLMQVRDAPEILYVRGRRDLSDAQAIAVVGARGCTRYGREQAQRISSELANMRVTVVSGMARGIDTAAHRGALKVGGRTVAVLGCGLDIAYPPENADLIEEVIDAGGSVISEYAPGMPPLAVNFPRRNRILSGMSAGVLLIEGKRSSGAMITVNLAQEQGREVYALPGNVDAPLSHMPLQLIAEGACMVRGAQDIVDALNWAVPEQPDQAEDAPLLCALTKEEEAVARCVENEPLSFDEIKNLTQLGADKLNSLLTILEIKEIMKQLPGKMYTLVR